MYLVKQRSRDDDYPNNHRTNHHRKGTLLTKVFGGSFIANQVTGLLVEGESVRIIVAGVIYSLGKSYFRQLVTTIKAALKVAVIHQQVRQVRQQATKVATPLVSCVQFALTLPTPAKVALSVLCRKVRKANNTLAGRRQRAMFC
jgi:hypothetical protein